MTEKKTKILPLTSNTMFKEVFGKKEGKDALTFLLSNYFEVDYKSMYDSIEYDDTYLGVDTNNNDYKYNTDIIISLNNEVITNIEMNRKCWSGLENRNLAYISRIYSNQFKKGDGKEEFKKAKKHIQINLNNYNEPIGRKVSISRLIDIETKEEKTDQIEIHEVNLELIKKSCYNKDIESLTGIEKLSMFLLSKTKEEMEKVMDKELESVLDKIEELSRDVKVIGWYNKEEEEKMIRNSIESDALERGEEKAKKEMVINMLKENADIDFISKVSGLTTNQINSIIKGGN